MLLSIDSALQGELTLAHSAGDEVLRTLVTAALRCVRQPTVREEVAHALAAG